MTTVLIRCQWFIPAAMDLDLAVMLLPLRITEAARTLSNIILPAGADKGASAGRLTDGLGLEQGPKCAEAARIAVARTESVSAT